MKSIKDTPFLFTFIFLAINFAMISLILFNYFSISTRTEFVDEYLKVDKNNKIYLNGLQNIHKTLMQKENTDIGEFLDDYVFDSSTEAIIFRESLKKIGFETSDYLVVSDQQPIFELNGEQVIATSLKYSLENVPFNKMIEFLELINENGRYDLINELTMVKNRNSNGVQMNFSYTNIGNSLGE